MERNITQRRGQGSGCVVFVLLIIAAFLVFWFSRTPEGKKAFQEMAAPVQPPVEISLTPFVVFNGYYVNVKNTSSSNTLTGVTVKYTDARNSLTQTIGTLRPGETKTLDPSDQGWTVAKNETISVSADGNFALKVLETNLFLDK